MAAYQVLTSGIWQTTTTILSASPTGTGTGGRGADRGCILIDPAYFPRELDAIADCATALGGADAIIFTHGHWDHVMGHTRFPGVPVHASADLAAAVARDDPRAARYLDDARDFDARWYVPRPGGHRWPVLTPLTDHQALSVAGVYLIALSLPGHSPDALALVDTTAGLLLAGDYLSPCEIPFVDDLPAYRASLVRLLALLPDLRTVIPGHGPILTSTAAAAIARADLAYLDRLADATDLPSALAVPLPRAADVPGMLDHHRDNCTKLCPPAAL